MIVKLGDRATRRGDSRFQKVKPEWGDPSHARPELAALFQVKKEIMRRV